jgi:mono/diheme cytochrome c family protein
MMRGKIRPEAGPKYRPENRVKGHAMKLALALAVCTLFTGAMLWAEGDDFAEYQGWMKSNAATVADLNKNLTAKDGAAAHTDVRKLQENLAMVMAYWQSRNINDGVRFSLDATYGLAQVDVLISQSKFDDAAAALKTAQTSCGSCHMAHRDKAADGSFKIKMK